MEGKETVCLLNHQSSCQSQHTKEEKLWWLMFHEETNLKRSWFCQWLYRSVKLVKDEILEGIGPSKPEPCNCLQKKREKTCLVLYVFSWGHASVYGERSKLLQFHYTCPIADEIWYPASEVIITYPPRITQIQ